MPSRPRSHELEKLSRIELHRIFSQCGWVIWDLSPDYGEDLFVRIFSRQAATYYSFFVQAKATDHIDKYIQKDGKHLSYPIKTDHIEYWNQFWEPVILTIWDSKSNIAYWEIIQDFVQENDISNDTRKQIRVSVPMENILDPKGLRKIHEKTKQRFERFNILAEGTDALVNILSQHFGIEVDGDSETSLWIISYPEKGVDSTVLLLGEFGEIFQLMAEKAKMDPQNLLNKLTNDYIAAEYFLAGHGTEKVLDSGRVLISIKYKDVVREFHYTSQEWEDIKRNHRRNHKKIVFD